MPPAEFGADPLAIVTGGARRLGAALARVEVRAVGILLGEVLDCCDAAPDGLRVLVEACLQAEPEGRPDLGEVVAGIGRT